MFAVDGYNYGGKLFDRTGEVAHMESEMPSLEKVIFLPYANEQAQPEQIKNAIFWQDAIDNDATDIPFAAVPFDHPLWTVYSSGTTGINGHQRV